MNIVKTINAILSRLLFQNSYELSEMEFYFWECKSLHIVEHFQICIDHCVFLTTNEFMFGARVAQGTECFLVVFFRP